MYWYVDGRLRIAGGLVCDGFGDTSLVGLNWLGRQEKLVGLGGDELGYPCLISLGCNALGSPRLVNLGRDDLGDTSLVGL